MRIILDEINIEFQMSKENNFNPFSEKYFLKIDENIILEEIKIDSIPDVKRK